MAERKETYIGNSKLKDSPEKPLKVILGEQVVKSKHIADGAVTKGKLGNRSVEVKNLDDDVLNLIASMEKGGVALSGEFGDSEMIGINQKKLTEVIGPEGTLQGNIDTEVQRAGEAETALDGRVSDLEEAVGEGGSIDERIATAKSELIDGASKEGDTFKKIEDRLSDIEESVGEGGSVDERIAVETNRAQAAEELLREAYESLSQSQVIPKTAEEWAAMTSWEEGVIYRVAGTTSYTDYMYNGTTTVPMATYDNAIDNEPTAGSDNLVKSSGVEQCNYDTIVRLANIEESINGEPTEKELIFEDETFTLSTVSSTEILIPIPTSIGNIGTTYIATISGSASVSDNGAFNISIVSGNSALTYIDTSLKGKSLTGVNRIKLVLKDTSTSECSLRILCRSVLPNGSKVHVKLEKFNTSDISRIKQYGTDELLDLLHFQEKKVINTVNDKVSLIPSTTLSDVECCVAKCKEGDEFIVNGTGYANARLWAFSDINGNILSRSGSNATESDTVITAPAGSSYVIINKTIDDNTCYTKQVKRIINTTKTQVIAQVKGKVDIDSLTKYAFYISQSLAPYTWSAGSNRRSVVIPVVPGNLLVIEPKDGESFTYMFLSSFTKPIAGDSVYNAGDKITSSETLCVEVPSTASYVYILYKNVYEVELLKDVFIRDDEVLTKALKEVEDNAIEYTNEKNTQLIKDLPNYVQQTGVNVQNLNQKTYGFQDVIGSWWFYPEAVSVNTYRKKLFFGFVDKEGFSGVAELTCDSKQPMLIKNRLKHEYPDTHDSVSVSILDDERLLAVFPDGHGTGKYINIRVSKNKYSIDEFEAPIRIKSDIDVAYSQVHKVNGKYYIFFRSPIKYWRYIVSEDLINWSDPVIFLHDSNDYQRYFLAKPISDEPNKLRFITYSNPTYNDTNIRAGYIDFETNEIYDSTGVKVGDFGGDTPVETNDFTILVQQPTSPNKNRMFDLAVTPMNTIRFVYCSFYNSSLAGTDSIYYMYDNGTIRQICAGGEAFWIPKAQGGVQFLSATKIVVARSDISSTGYDYIEIYELENGSINLVKEVYKELKTGKNKNRNSYVLADINGRYVIWFRGYYASYGSSSTYMRYDYDTDVMIYDVINDKLFGGDY